MQYLSKNKVIVVVDGTDLLVILTDMPKDVVICRWKINVTTKAHVYDLQALKDYLGEILLSSILVVHAFILQDMIQ